MNPDLWCYYFSFVPNLHIAYYLGKFRDKKLNFLNEEQKTFSTILTFDTSGNIGWQERLPNANGRKGTPQEINFFYN